MEDFAAGADNELSGCSRVVWIWTKKREAISDKSQPQLLRWWATPLDERGEALPSSAIVRVLSDPLIRKRKGAARMPHGPVRVASCVVPHKVRSLPHDHGFVTRMSSM